MYIHLHRENKPINDIDYLNCKENFIFLGHIINNDIKIGSIAFSYDRKFNIIYIYFIVISKQYTGKGYSREVLEYLDKLFNNPIISGTACVDNEAIAYWTHMGAKFNINNNCERYFELQL